MTDRGCRFPGCTAGVWFCDVDHNTPTADGGGANAENCGLFCRRHHRLKTFTRWTWRRRPDGSVRWTDPLGLDWADDPVRHLLPPTADSADPDPPVQRRGAAAPAEPPVDEPPVDEPPVDDPPVDEPPV